MKMFGDTFRVGVTLSKNPHVSILKDVTGKMDYHLFNDLYSLNGFNLFSYGYK